jgi:hypothetical protein
MDEEDKNSQIQGAPISTKDEMADGAGIKGWRSLVLGMAIRVRVSGHPRVLHSTGADSVAFFHLRVEPEPDLHRIRFGCGFYFSPAGSPDF